MIRLSDAIGGLSGEAATREKPRGVGYWQPAWEPAPDKIGREQLANGELVNWDYYREIASERRKRLLIRAASMSLPGSHLGTQTLDTFLQSSENRHAFRLAKRASESDFSGWIYGPVGAGKSHLAKSVLKAARAAGKPAIYTTVELMLVHVRETYDHNGDRDERTAKGLYAEVPVLLIDDLGKETFSRGWAASMVFEIMNAREDLGMPTFVTTNHSFVAAAELYAKKTSRDPDKGLDDPTTGIGIVDRLRKMAGGDDNIVEIAGSSMRGIAR